jgi:hypothetical protein
MNQAQRLQHALADPIGADVPDACEAVNRTLVILANWLDVGAIHEAAALNADAGNIVGLVARLARATGGPPPALRLPEAKTLRSLTRLPAVAASHHREVSHWVDLNLAEAPLTDRLASIRSLRLLDPRNIGWKRTHEELETAVVRLWEDETERCIAAGDPKAVDRLNEQIVAMGFLGRSGQRLLHLLKIARTRNRAMQADQELAPLGTQLHLAWASMDVPLARRVQTAWRHTAELAEGDHEQDTRAVFAWLDLEDRHAAEERETKQHLDDLVRALDELQPVHAVERRYAAIRDVQAQIPSAIESRVSHYITAERRKRTRRFVVVLSSIIAVAGVLTSIILINTYSARRQQMIENLSVCISEHLEAGRLREAQDCWEQAVNADVSETPIIAAHAAGIERAKQTMVEWRNHADSDLELARTLLEGDDVELAHIDEAIALLQAAEPDLRPSSLTVLQQQVRRATSLRSDRIAALRDQITGELAAIEALLAEPQPAHADQRGWKARVATLQRAVHMLLQVRERPAADAPDLRQRAAGLQARIDNYSTQAAQRVAGMDEADHLLSELRRIPSSECSWANTWDDLLDSHADLLIGDSSRDWEGGRSRAHAACASENWRRVVLPKLNLYGLLGNGAAPPNPRAARTTLKSHLDLFAGDQSPYRGVATRLIDQAERLERQHLADALRSKVEATGLLELYVADTVDGYRYLRPFENGLRRIDSRQDLSKDPIMLKELTSSEEHDLYSHPKPAVIALALQKGLDAYDAAGVATTESVCNLLQEVQECPEPDGLLSLAVQKILWDLILELAIPIPDQTREAATTWLGHLGSGGHGSLRADWAQRSMSANASVQQMMRRTAQRDADASPRHHQIRSLDLADLRRDELRAMAGPRVIGGLLVPEPDGPAGTMRVQLLQGEVQHPEVLLQRPDGWHFTQFDDRLVHDALVDAPQGIRGLPVIIFITP